MDSQTPKSILKKPGGPDATTEAQAVRAQRNRDIAIHHATLIQQQKDAEAQILEAIEELIDFPSTENADPSNPSSVDVSRFTSLVAPFQPSDYDSLIEERHCAEVCGYALCPRKPLKQNTTAKMRILGRKGTGEDLKFVPTKQLELWCSEDCAKRALYIKAQLNEEPAWLRRASKTMEITLLNDEPRRTFTATLPQRLKGTTSKGSDAEIENSLSNLALERGEQPSSARPTGLMNNNILENAVTRAAVPPSLSTEIEDYKQIENYDPQVDFNEYLKASRAQDDDEDRDWDI
ncbi:hypothetical protein EV356DRAFT_530459 [Viridothelium virens]|uniref:RNA polymerase II subunit B1 CTD phosphatase RPAP2 homolog n=1 Tax=Viridothelium virens TaxID=1048519 RepID=A0A6A6HFQ0_VIRVR|nr:hypothetical protein EV356DRAFT_530459 [Viridothelium virens]